MSSVSSDLLIKTGNFLRANEAYAMKFGGNAVMVHFFACCFPEQLPLAVASVSRRNL